LEPCVDDIGVLADGVFSALQPWLDRPLALFGHSLGAILGFELARRIEARPDATLLRLFASGRRAPSAFRDDRVYERDDDSVLAELAGLSGTDSRILGDEEIMRFAMPAIRADYKAAESYRLEEEVRLRCPITVLTGDADPKMTLDEARAWELHTQAELDLRVFDGGHFFLVRHQRQIAELVTEQLSPYALSSSN
jgi:surfactin synthase thioesterase subunit